MKPLTSEVKTALRNWFGDQALQVEALGDGHINGTWRVTLAAPAVTGTEKSRYVVQKLSPSVFVEPEAVMANLLQVVPRGAGAKTRSPLPYLLPEPLPAQSGEVLVGSGKYPLAGGGDRLYQWRLANYVEHSRSLSALESNVQAEAAGRAFGEFQAWLGGLQGVVFTEVIRGFHQLPHYLQSLEQAVQQVRQRGQSLTAAEVLLVEGLQTRDYLQATDGGRATPVLIHGDCKVNNLLFADTRDVVIAILDLDTMMHGPWWFDFGDLVRSATCSSAGEFNTDHYPALAEGFFAGRRGFVAALHEKAMADVQLSDAVVAPAYMTYMLCVRFLTDHLNGDRYFRVAQRGDNLRRAELQYQLLNTLESDDTMRFMRAVLRELV